jgi:hypothetical protein
LRLGPRCCVLFIVKIWWWIKGMHRYHVKKMSKKEEKWMNNGWSKVTIQEKFSKNIDFILFGIAMYLG